MLRHLLKPIYLLLPSLSIFQDRLLGLLMPFRAFGDVKFKWSIELQKGVLESGPDQLHENEHTKFIPPNYHTPPYLTAEPEITHHKLRPQDRFVVRRELSSVFLTQTLQLFSFLFFYKILIHHIIDLALHNAIFCILAII